MGQKLPALIGIVVIVGIAWLFSGDKKAINRRLLFWGLALQFILAVVILKGAAVSAFLTGFFHFSPKISAFLVLLLFFLLWFYPRSIALRNLIPPKPFKLSLGILLVFFLLHSNLVEWFFNQTRLLVAQVIQFTGEGSKFVFGTLGESSGPAGLVFAFQVLPTIILVASIFASLYYLGLMQRMVAFFAGLMNRFLAVSGAESTSVAASLFLGQTEAPLSIRPYLARLTRSELMTIMTAGFAHVSAGIMPAYVMVGAVDIKHLLTAVLMTAPGAILMAKMLIPETDRPETGKQVEVKVPISDVNLIDALARGAGEGGLLALNVTGMLIAFIALIALVNGGFSALHGYLESLAGQLKGVFLAGPVLQFFAQIFPEKLEQLLGWLFSPLAWALGVPLKDVAAVGGLMGTRMVLNEFVAFIMLSPLKTSLDPRSFIIATYALCGFANLGSIAIQIGGIGALVPERRHELAKLGLKAMLAGSLANFLSAAIVSLLI